MLRRHRDRRAEEGGGAASRATRGRDACRRHEPRPTPGEAVGGGRGAVSDLVAVVASDADARRAAEERLADGGTAAEAALAGWFAIAGASTWGLFAPMTLAVAGGGGGIRFVDGRARQPGKGFDRPVRYPAGKEPPAVSRAAVPGSA